jgi:hypothetical protein
MLARIRRNITSYSANQVARRLGEEAIIWINPANVRFNVANIRTRKPKNIGRFLERAGLADKRSRGISNLFYRNQFIIENGDFAVKGPVTEMRTTILVEDYVNNIADVRNSILYRQYVADIEKSGFAHHKRTVFRDAADVDAFFRNYLFPLYESLKSDGYVQSRSPDKCKCYISADGEVMQGENGRHRLAFARALGIPQFPFAVFGAHESWYRENIGEKADFSRLAGEIRKIEERYR